MNRNPMVRLALAALEKPTFVKSLNNGMWYCGVHVTQTLHPRYVAAHWNCDPERSSLDRTIYGRGKTPKEAYEAWLASFGYRTRRLPRSYEQWKRNRLPIAQTVV